MSQVIRFARMRNANAMLAELVVQNRTLELRSLEDGSELVVTPAPLNDITSLWILDRSE